MPTPLPPLPEDIARAVRFGERDYALQRLREHLNLSEADASELLNRYQEDTPPIRLRGAGIIRRSPLNALVWLAFILILAVVGLLLSR
ncbi:hypothetical protein SAMN05216600_102403 [Pseudomonas cuatrocienegasensis]|uniref:Uncharacterized protein n=1 Tax=Pseudomonas cuatrocienegasensis TaxID=543360 RepID=A0ABY1B5N9_9PSED|nr:MULTISPECIES: hypothetical protein [Pseudomonas]OEC37412.1 hypothetical protein A7D25_01755 [Pseudomonas sp. 21C1]SEP95869.1 hypothetical protein SAMN05216600_102403 [Pseudomonas cuatrocienegasensis]